MIATWQAAPPPSEFDTKDVLVDENGRYIAMVEDFGYACYPTAINVKTGHLERGGAYKDRVAAKLWAERVAGLHPLKEGDERPFFYYRPGDDS